MYIGTANTNAELSPGSGGPLPIETLKMMFAVVQRFSSGVISFSLCIESIVDTNALEWLRNCTLPKLQYLEFEGTLTEPLYDFIHRHNAKITHLILSKIAGSLRKWRALGPCPRLTHYEGPNDYLPLVAPGSVLLSVVLYIDGGYNEMDLCDTLSSISQTKMPLLKAYLLSECWHADCLGILAQHAPKLCELIYQHQCTTFEDCNEDFMVRVFGKFQALHLTMYDSCLRAPYLLPSKALKISLVLRLSKRTKTVCVVHSMNSHRSAR